MLGEYVIWKKTLLGEKRYFSKSFYRKSWCIYTSNAEKFETKAEAHEAMEENLTPKEQKNCAVKKIDWNDRF
jgi:hypothetical protein